VKVYIGLELGRDGQWVGGWGGAERWGGEEEDGVVNV
jgi:hypothetical protein